MQRQLKQKNTQRARRRGRVRAKISGTAQRPRLVVFRSSNFTYAQLIDDVAGKTIVAADSRGVKGETETERARETGRTLAQAAQKKGVKTAMFDRGGYAYAGRVRAVAEGARTGGLVI